MVAGEWKPVTMRYRCRFVVIATGYDHDPDLPDWPGAAGIRG
jgi:cation diffusion facilitator CzcD-associated flavoprotein CzcO